MHSQKAMQQSHVWQHHSHPRSSTPLNLKPLQLPLILKRKDLLWVVAGSDKLALFWPRKLFSQYLRKSKEHNAKVRLLNQADRGNRSTRCLCATCSGRCSSAYSNTANNASLHHIKSNGSIRKQCFGPKPHLWKEWSLQTIAPCIESHKQIAAWKRWAVAARSMEQVGIEEEHLERTHATQKQHRSQMQTVIEKVQMSIATLWTFSVGRIEIS